MPRYITTVNATSNSSPNTNDIFFEVSAGRCRISLIRVRLGDGTATAGLDNDYLVTLEHETSSTAGTSATPNVYPLDQVERQEALTYKVKSGATALALGGGTNIILDKIVKNGRETFEYVARDEDSMFGTLASSTCFAVLIASPVASQKFQVTVITDE